jgi:hypothetical protein
VSCSKKLELGDFDIQVWKNDSYGCNGGRKQQFEKLNKVKNVFIGITENQLHQFLGKPNKQELKERNTKSYFYFLDRNSLCDSSINVMKNDFLIVEINAINQVVSLRYAFE